MPSPLGDLVAAAAGARHREDPTTPAVGGPAGNARLTAWTGLLLLVFFAVEGITLLSLQVLITVHIFVGTFLVPLLLLKTATVGWRIGRYYTGSPAYRSAGPPPVLLRLLGPLVIVSGLAVVASGLALILLGESSFTPIVTVAGNSVDAFTLHQASFIGWFAITTVHVLARTVPALQIVARDRRSSGRTPGGAYRGVILVATVAAAVVLSLLVVHRAGDWTGGDPRGGGEASTAS